MKWYRRFTAALKKFAPLLPERFRRKRKTAREQSRELVIDAILVEDAEDERSFATNRSGNQQQQSSTGWLKRGFKVSLWILGLVAVVVFLYVGPALQFSDDGEKQPPAVQQTPAATPPVAFPTFPTGSNVGVGEYADWAMQTVVVAWHDDGWLGWVTLTATILVGLPLAWSVVKALFQVLLRLWGIRVKGGVPQGYHARVYRRKVRMETLGPTLVVLGVGVAIVVLIVFTAAPSGMVLWVKTWGPHLLLFVIFPITALGIFRHLETLLRAHWPTFFGAAIAVASWVAGIIMVNTN